MDLEYSAALQVELRNRLLTGNYWCHVYNVFAAASQPLTRADALPSGENGITGFVKNKANYKVIIACGWSWHVSAAQTKVHFIQII
jgi:hypothetical protein